MTLLRVTAVDHCSSAPLLLCSDEGSTVYTVVLLLHLQSVKVRAEQKKRRSFAPLQRSEVRGLTGVCWCRAVCSWHWADWRCDLDSTLFHHLLVLVDTHTG